MRGLDDWSERLPDGIDADLKTEVVEIVDSFVVRILVRHKDGSTDRTSVGVFAINEQVFVVVGVDVVGHCIVACEDHKLQRFVT